jgi:hypothetical protein
MAAVMVPQVLTVIQAEFPEHERPRAFGLPAAAGARPSHATARVAA